MAVMIWTFCLVLTRVTTFVTVLPLFGAINSPRLVKAALAMALTVVWFMPMAEAMSPAVMLRPAVSESWVTCMIAVGREILLGGILGYGLGLFLVPVQVAGEYLTQEMGLSFGSQVNPGTSMAASPYTQILELLAIAIFFGCDGHHVLLGVLHATFAQYPLTGALPDVPLPRLVAGATMAQEWGLMLAAPIGLLLFLTTVFLALLTRAAPQMNLYAIGFPLRLGVGLVASLLLLPGWINAVVSAFSHFGQLASQLM
ncbi:MAG TPA: flagellar biosynthetic protein FliR [Gemmataceae bacterium]|nr:flagellar biosynthetic protein FliR [Gemmataceae bacterium]